MLILLLSLVARLARAGLTCDSSPPGFLEDFWSDYQDLASHSQLLCSLLATPAGKRKAKVETIGTTIEGRPMQLLKICSGRCGSKPIIWVDSVIHAREWIGAAATTYLAKGLITGETAAAKAALRMFDWFILPVTNPDGYSASHSGRREQRKNRRPGPERCQEEDEPGGTGVDLNRNFGHNWKSNEPKICKGSYPGKSAFSEPESRAIRDFLMPKYRGKVVIYNSVHAAGQAFIIPWGSQPNKRWSGRPGVEAVLKAGQAAMGEHGAAYRIGTVMEVFGVKANGGAPDWAAAVLKAKFPFVTELVDKKRWGRTPPKENIKKEVEGFFDFMMAAAVVADKSQGLRRRENRSEKYKTNVGSDDATKRQSQTTSYLVNVEPV